MADLVKLIHVLYLVLVAGKSCVVDEHKLDVMAEADWMVDMCPEAGDGGGKIVAEGTPAEIARRKKQSHTGRVLSEFLKGRTMPAAPASRAAG